MNIEDRILDCIEELTCITVDDENLDMVKAKISSLLDYIGYVPEAETIVKEESRPVLGENGIDDKLIKYLEELSRLSLTEEEEEKAKQDLTKILGYIDMLNQLDTTDVEPMSHPFEFTNNFRVDESKPSTERELILKNAPQQKDGCFKVPTTVE